MEKHATKSKLVETVTALVNELSMVLNRQLDTTLKVNKIKDQTELEVENNIELQKCLAQQEIFNAEKEILKPFVANLQQAKEHYEAQCEKEPSNSINVICLNTIVCDLIYYSSNLSFFCMKMHEIDLEIIKQQQFLILKSGFKQQFIDNLNRDLKFAIKRSLEIIANVNKSEDAILPLLNEKEKEIFGRIFKRPAKYKTLTL